MLSRNLRPDAPFSVHVPAAADDRPSWTRVGVIAAIGFIVGVAWPKLAGVRLGPSLPETATTATATAAAAASAAPSNPAAPTGSSVPAVAATPIPSTPAPGPVSVTVSHGTLYACKTAEGDALKAAECGALPGIDSVVMPRLRKLSDCADAAQASGKLHFVARVDFPRSAVSIELGKNPGLSSADGILACAKEAFAGAAPPNGSHDNPRYSVAYTITFGTPSPSGTPAPSASPSAARVASDATQVVWDVAIVRDAPKSGKVVARLQRGTTLQVGAVKDGWYPVKFGDGFASEGWVYRGAIGR
jgi:hypothetical protein